MKYMRTMTRTTWMRLLLLVAVLYAPCPMSHVFAQIKIGGNVYGGGNEGVVMGNTTVTVCAGDIGARPETQDPDTPLENPSGKVFGGARMANVGGNAYVHIDGANATDDIVINQVYGGNDISGVIGANPNVPERLPEELTGNTKGVNGSWNSFVRVSSAQYTQAEIEAAGEDTSNPAYGKTAGDNKKDIFIGKLFGGGNGDYYYHEKDGKFSIYFSKKYFDGTSQPVPIASNTTGFNVPELARSFIDIHGGTISDSYGGGNNATVTEKAVICVNNLSKVVTQINRAGEDLLTVARYRDMGIWAGLSHLDSDEFQMGSVFGGNNKADMAIRPTWHLQEGQIRHLYSGGNRGRMIHENGIFLEIPNGSNVKVDNLYGGCRMADVRPLVKGTDNDVSSVTGSVEGYDYHFPPNLAARVIVAGGDVNNVYGGNDVRGRVYFGNAVGILTSIRGDVYGGGNGAYAYTDSPSNEDSELYGDYYYSPDDYTSSLDALSALRPDAEQVSIQVRGTETNPTIIQGSIYVGGNCATLRADPNHSGLYVGKGKKYPLTELKMGSNVIAENVFLGNNGEKMVDKDILKLYKSEGFSSLQLENADLFASYMEGVSLAEVPSLVVEDEDKGDRMSYSDYSSYIGSLYYGSNRGSMTYSGPIEINLNTPIYIYNKLVAGCNNANIPLQRDSETGNVLNARFEGGILGSADERDDIEGNARYIDNNGNIRDRVLMNLSEIRIKPMRLNSEKTALEWNTIKNYKDDQGEIIPVAFNDDTWCTTGEEGEDVALNSMVNRRLYGGNIYGGCCESGHVNGNVVINIKGSLLNRNEIFAQFTPKAGDEDEILYDYEPSDYNITDRVSGVILNEQGMDVLGEALSVYGGGKGAGTEIWGSATVNIEKGYSFQIFGGSESGVIGKGQWQEGTLNTATNVYEGGKYIYPTEPNDKYSTYVNLNCGREGVSRANDSSEEMADVEFIYGGGNNGLIVGNTHVNLDNGRLFNSFAGSCNANVLGHTETYVGLNGFPYLRDHIYGGNDLGGEILGSADFTGRVSETALPMVHQNGDGIKDVLKANAYVEYRKGRMKYIHGGCFGDYDYDHEFTTEKGYSFPKLHNAFVNFRPDDNVSNHVDKVFGAGEGIEGVRVGDKMQDCSYVLIDIADSKKYYINTEVFGSGSNNGLGMGYGKRDDNSFVTFDSDFNLDEASAIVDLVRGFIGAAYGGSYNEGITRRTVLNVPEGSTIKIGSIFGGAYGMKILPPCDVYESNVNYHSSTATLIYDPGNVNYPKADAESVSLFNGAIYGGNNNERRTLYAKVNIDVPVAQEKIIQYNDEIKNMTKGQVLMTNATVYGAGKGVDTWSEYTEVNLKDGAKVYEVYGGGQMGHVLNAESVQKYMQTYSHGPSSQISQDDPHWGERWNNDWQAAWKDAWTMGDYYMPADNNYTDYIGNAATNLSRRSARPELDDDTVVKQLANPTKKYNANVIINKGATVVNYAYGGGLGDVKKALSGDVYGTTYIALLGGTVNKDIYAAGTAGGVYDLFGAKNFTASANAYIKGGITRNVYGGGWRGSVGYHNGLISDVENNANDVFGQSNVIIGDPGGGNFLSGEPAIMRNVYGGGEGGGIFGTASVYVNNGRIGYRYENNEYVPELHDVKEGDSLLYKSGNVFGGGYVANSYVDHSSIEMYGGTVRGSLYGGGEVGPIGRGTMKIDAPGMVSNGTAKIYKPGSTRLEMYGGHVLRNVFGGGRGHDNWDGEGYMTAEEKLTMDRSAKGYVFGQTLVHIHGGEIGTEGGLAENSGNVFGGGDYGFVYSAYENASGKICYGKKNGVRYDDNDEGYYYKFENGAFVTDNDTGEKMLTEDCKVLIEPQTKVLSNVTINSHDYTPGQFVPISDLNTLENKTTDAVRWGSLDPTGIIIHNGVFAGGNTVTGSIVNANTVTVYGNATASIHDIYHRDLITLGTSYIGGLYGDGNLTLVDGYRGLNITNYGTDYYSIDKEINLNTYKTLPAREAAYYELKYKCKKACTDKDGTRYNPSVTENNVTTKASTITADDMIVLFLENDGTPVKVDDEGNRITPGEEGGTAVLEKEGDKWVPKASFWEESGVLPIYAGRLMNSIQRADFCGVFGSRMVMRGAKDRVPEIADFTNYTINRVREVSLNQQHSVIPSDLTLKNGGTRESSVNPENENPDNYADLDKAIHGNYFGIYNIVNYLGALTSDVHFKTNEDKRRTSNTNIDYQPEGSDDVTYYGWKSKHIKDRKRNNGTSLNKVALASGVYLELTTEKKQGTDLGLYEKDWGYITGVIELDLINVQTGIGGGFVYAKNEHGIPAYTPKKHITLTELNKDAVTRKDFTYSNSDKVEWETSGNFVHSTQTIIDDCYNISGKYSGEDAVPAHYWYIKGQVYVYDQYISAYTGAPNAYSESVEIPLTITAASHGTMKLLNVMPNRYAYYSSPGVPLELGKKVNINDVEYYKNDPISYWDWNLLSNSEKELFVEKTYVTNDSCKIGNHFYPRGYVMLPAEYDNLKAASEQKVLETGAEPVPAVQKATKDTNGNDIVVRDDDGNIVYRAFDFVFRESNNLRHNTGYILSYKVNNPLEWDAWYTPKLNGSKISLETYKKKSVEQQNQYEDGPTYRLTRTTGGEVLGQSDFKVGDLISQDVQTTYQAIPNKPTGQAEFVPAYLVTKQMTVTDINGGTHHLNPGSAVSENVDGYTSPAFICTSTIKLSDTEYIYIDARMTEDEKEQYKTDYPSLAQDIDKYVVPAYYCTVKGRYGGNYYESGKNYRGLEAWSSMSEDDRSKFTFNYDALDLLIDQNYSGVEGKKYQYDGLGFTTEDQAKSNPAGYSVTTPVDYTATYNGTTDLTYIKVDGTEATAKNGDELKRAEFERLTNEQRHYTPISPMAVNDYKVYVVKTPFQVGNSPYAVGQTISATEYSGLSDSNQDCIDIVEFSSGDKETTFYYCREAYTIDNTDGHPVRSIHGDIYAKGATVPLGAVIEGTSTTEGYTGYNGLTNNQKDFTIHGISPTETSTLFVSRESDIFDLSTEKIITVIYEYDYEESDTNGNTTPVSERHVVNIHVTFKSGVPTVEDIKAPEIVIPGDYISMISPHVSEGAYEVTDYGWELFERIGDAESHTNGIEFTPDADPLYWYQDGHYLAYYAKTYLGKTYSNHVPVSVANYHDLKKVMEAKEHHYYVDDPYVKREPKIYINDYSQDETNKNGLDLLKNLFALSVLNNPELNNDGFIKSGDFAGHKPLGNTVVGGDNLEFILRTDLSHTDPWTPIASGESEPCFSGTFHGDGHTISGLDNSLFGKLCGSVYNLGVTGSFKGAGVADTGDGYVENCWINTTGTPDGSVYAVFGDPTASATELSPIPRQIVNSYYQDGKNYKTDTSDRGVATAMSDKAFYSGEVAYDLNGFYLYKRYNDNAKPEGSTTYRYWLPGNDMPQDGRYAENKALCSSGFNSIKYVEDRFADGDFIYAGGVVPTSEDKRLYTYTVKTESGNDKLIRDYYPIWPDDYLFFGQKLTYGYVESSAHQDVPSIYMTDNRVYRAPAYFRNSEMKVAHFNPNAVFAQADKNVPTQIAYKNMTAIDFTGGNGDVAGGYDKGLQGTKFYPPLLDDGGLTGFTNVDLTQNLLVYTTTTGENTTAGEKTATVISGYLVEPEYAESSEGYRSVAYQNPGNVHGHWIEDRIATRNHFLVDKQDFYAPIEYTFASDKRMWYQRVPDANEFVDIKKGWQAISLPFTAELVTTSQKGEITHFYGSSVEGENGLVGHEYWLRELTGDLTVMAGTDNKVLTAGFSYPAGSGSYTKSRTNTFLWDYYYFGTDSGRELKDWNGDTYQKYYQKGRDYHGYPLLASGTPYLLGLPGKTYYEFDLSGNFKPTSTAVPYPAKLDPQTITFASVLGVTIHKSDDDMAGVEKSVTINGKTFNFTFKTNYLNEEFEAGSNNYTLEAEYDSDNDNEPDCSRFGKVPETGDPTPVSAFRPYFLSSSAAGNGSTRTIVFDNDLPEPKGEVEYGDPRQDSFDGTLNIYAKKDKIYIVSQLSYTTDVRVVTPAGITVASATVKPGQTIKVQADFFGMYVVHTLDGRYTKSVIVKK